jgi:hypothetical protein
MFALSVSGYRKNDGMKISILKQTPTVFISDQLNLKKIYSFVPPPKSYSWYNFTFFVIIDNKSFDLPNIMKGKITVLISIYDLNYV